MTDPIASYNEIRFDERRRFELYADKITCRGKHVRVDFEATVHLADLRPDPSRIWIRRRAFIGGVSMMLLAVVFATVVVVLRPADEQIFGWCVSAVGGLSFVGLVICLKTFRKVEFARFQSHQGLVLLDVGDEGPDRANYREFLELLSSQIRASQPKSASG